MEWNMVNNKFEAKSRNVEDLVCVDLHGYLDAHTAPELEKALADIVDSGRYRIIVNFNGLDYISSAGLGVFMAFIEDVRNSGGDIKMSDMNEKVYSVFDLLGFPLLFDIVKTENEAIGKFIESEPVKNVE